MAEQNHIAAFSQSYESPDSWRIQMKFFVSSTMVAPLINLVGYLSN
jgi:hypothetical protein